MSVNLLESAAHWDRLANESERMAEWDRSIGIDLSPPGQSAGDHRARLYRSTARAIRAEAWTGVHFCNTHEVPMVICIKREQRK